MFPPRRLRLRPALLLAASLLLYLALLGRRDIVTGHEARVAQTARLMAQSWPWQGDGVRVRRVVLTDAGGGVLRLYPAPGGDTVAVNPWLVPVLQGRIRLQKPPLAYWCAAAVMKLAAGPLGVEACARLVPALMGALGVLLIYDLGRRLLGRAGGWAAGLIWIGSYLAFDEYRLAIPDPYLAFFTLVCVWAWARAGGKRRGRGYSGRGECPVAAHDAASPISGHSRSRKAAVGAPRRESSASRTPSLPSLLLFYLSLALGVLAKGPVIFLHVGIALVAFHVCYRRRLPGGVRDHAMGALLLSAVAAPWFVYIYRHVPDAAALWRYESVGELSGNTEKPGPWWFYVPNSFWMALPWTPLWAAGLSLPFVRRRTDPPRRRPADNRMLFPVLWYAATVLFFCFLHQKKPTYLLPALPAQVLLTARAAVALLGHARLTWARGGKWRSPCPAGRRDTAGYLPGAQAVLGLGFALALPVLFRLVDPKAPPTAIVLAGLAAGAAPLWALLRRPQWWLAAQAAGCAVLVALFQAGFVTPRDNHRSARPACAVAAAMLRERGTTLLSRWPFLADEAAVYLPPDVADGTGPGVGHRVLMIFDDQEAMNLRRRAGRYAAAVPAPVPAGDGEVPEKYLRQWEGWVGEGRVVEARRVPVPGEAGDVRWKLFELVVDRRQFTGVAGPPQRFTAGSTRSVSPPLYLSRYSGRG